MNATMTASQGAAHAPYRPDIDGLRALAVLAVIGFHASAASVPGGFAGVDIFFVISGFLITDLIAREMEQGKFSLAEFYNRRVKRILPAYVVVALFTLAVSSYLLIPNDYVFYTTSLAASWGFVSNVFFSLLSWGYFGQRTEEFPLLHTWSLSVEEQFYFFYPLLLMFLYGRWRRHIVPILLALALAGLVLSQWQSASVGAFFLLPYRAHELLIGALCAFALARSRPASAARATTFAGLGLALATGSLLLLRPQYHFPGVNSLFPCLGAAFLIYGGARPNPVSRLLGARLPVAIGLMSYSLYLWHWPVFSFLRYRHITLDAPTGAAAVALSVLLAYLSWRFIEVPARRQRTMRLRASLPLYYGAPAAFFLAIGLYSYATEGAPGRFPAEARQLIASYSFERDLTGACAIKSGQYQGVTLAYLQANCTVGAARAGQAELLLFGDSHANHFKPFVEQLASDAQLKLSYFVEGSCSAIDLFEPGTGQSAPTPCQRRNADLLALAPHFRFVVLASLWQYKGHEALFDRHLEGAVRRIVAAGAIPVVFKDSPSIATDLSHCVLYQRRGWIDAGANCSMPSAAVDAAQGSMNRVIDALHRRYRQMIVIDPKLVMCDATACATSFGNTALYKDGNHLNAKASQLLAQRYLAREGNPFGAGVKRPLDIDQLAYRKRASND
jgi:peptidoglycan/LPS O-acetylase OafA/YrhL